MAVVKLPRKGKLDELVSKVTLRLGKKPVQQEVLDKCVELAAEHFDELLGKLAATPVLDEKKLAAVLGLRERLSRIPWYDDRDTSFASPDDEDIYTE